MHFSISGKPIQVSFYGFQSIISTLLSCLRDNKCICISSLTPTLCPKSTQVERELWIFNYFQYFYHIRQAVNSPSQKSIDTQQNKTISHRILLKGPFKNMLGQGSTTFLAPGFGLWKTISPQTGMGTGGVRGGAMGKAETVLG